MKKILFICITLIVSSGFVNSQTLKFFVNKGTTSSTNCSCKTTKSIKITFPVPINVVSYDQYSFYLSLSSLDVTASVSFEKKDIASKLVGKNEFSAYLIKEDSTSDFYFDDAYLSLVDLCINPRMWGIQNLEIEGGSVGYKKIGEYTETVYNEYYKRWDTKTFDEWDEGTVYATGVFNMEQAPLSDGFSDMYNLITVKAENTDSTTFSISEDLENKGSLCITDKSEEFETTITYATWGGGDETYSTIKKNIENSIGGKFQVGPVHTFYELRGMQAGRELVIPGKTNGYSKATFNGVTYETIAHARTEVAEKDIYAKGFYSTFYILRSGDYTTLIVSITEEMSHKKPKGLSLMDGYETIYTFKITEENCRKVDKITEKWLNATTYNFKK